MAGIVGLNFTSKHSYYEITKIFFPIGRYWLHRLLGNYRLAFNTSRVSLQRLHQSNISKLELVIFPLDIFVSVTGLYSIWLNKQNDDRWKIYALMSLLLTSVSGLQAVSYWTLAQETDLSWWIPNLFLLIYPFFFIPTLIRQLTQSDNS